MARIERLRDVLFQRLPMRDLHRTTRAGVLGDDARVLDLRVDFGCRQGRLDHRHLRPSPERFREVLLFPELAVAPRLRASTDLQVKVGIAGIAQPVAGPIRWGAAQISSVMKVEFGSGR